MNALLALLLASMSPVDEDATRGCNANDREAAAEAYAAHDFPKGPPLECEVAPHPDSFGWSVDLIELCGNPYTSFIVEGVEHQCFMREGRWSLRRIEP